MRRPRVDLEEKHEPRAATSAGRRAILERNRHGIAKSTLTSAAIEKLPFAAFGGPTEVPRGSPVECRRNAPRADIHLRLIPLAVSRTKETSALSGLNPKPGGLGLRRRRSRIAIRAGQGFTPEIGRRRTARQGRRFLRTRRCRLGALPRRPHPPPYAGRDPG
jgi:hypothetical protein